MMNDYRLSWFHRLLSYLKPIRIQTISSLYHPQLELELYRNEIILGTPAALYSVGRSYAPFLKAFKQIEHHLPQVNHFLLLGTGLGSAWAILRQKYHLNPKSTLIDIDQKIIEFSQEWIGDQSGKVNWICADAQKFLSSHTEQYDLIGIDIFKDLYNPDWVYQQAFIREVYERLNLRGIAVFNYIFQDNFRKTHTLSIMENEFEQIETVSHKLNTIVIARK
jgi:spermidine synthase